MVCTIPASVHIAGGQDSQGSLESLHRARRALPGFRAQDWWFPMGVEAGRSQPWPILAQCSFIHIDLGR